MVKQLVWLTTLKDLNMGNLGRTWETIKDNTEFRIDHKPLEASPL